MITQEGKKELGELSIQLEKNTFQQGEKVQGTLKLILNEKYNGEVIYLLLLGKVFAKTYRHQLNEKTQKWDDININEDSNSFICQRYELFSFKKNLTSDQSNPIVSVENEGDLMINPGQYQISFHFQLPDSLDYSSTACKGAYGISKDVSDHYDFHVKYFIEVFIPTKDTTCTPISDKFNITIIGNDVITRKKSDNKSFKKESSISSSSGCFCFSPDSYVIRTLSEKMCYQSQQKISVNLEVDGAGNSKQITKVTFEFKRLLIFKNGYQCSKELKIGETSIKFVNQKANEVFECSLPIALALSHHSNLVDLKYVAEFKFYSGNTLLDIHQHDFYLEPNIALDKWEEKNVNDNNEEDSNEDLQVNILRANSNINWQKCKSTVDYYYTNLDHFRKIPTIQNSVNVQ